MSYLKKRIPQNSIKKNAWVAFFLGLSVFLILTVFQPFGTYNFQDSAKTLLLSGYGFVIGITYFIFANGLPFVFSRIYKKESWTFGKEIIHIFVVFFLVVVATYIYRNVAFGLGYQLRDFLVYSSMAFATAVFPLSLIFVIRLMQLKNKPTIIYQTAQVQQNIFITVEGENKNEKIKFAKEELLFIKASENYVVIHLDKNGKVTKHILRSSLSKLAEQIEDQDILQVHRSYLVNFENILSLSGKSPNYVLALKNLKEEIPISRTKVKLLRKKLQEKPL